MQSQWKWIELTVAHSRIEARWEIATSLRARAKSSQIKHARISQVSHSQEINHKIWNVPTTVHVKCEKWAKLPCNSSSWAIPSCCEKHFPSLTFDRVKREVQWDETMTRSVHRIIMSDSRGFLIINRSLEGHFPSCWPSSFLSSPRRWCRVEMGRDKDKNSSHNWIVFERNYVCHFY